MDGFPFTFLVLKMLDTKDRNCYNVFSTIILKYEKKGVLYLREPRLLAPGDFPELPSKQMIQRSKIFYRL